MKSSQFHATALLFLSNILLSHQNCGVSSPQVVYESKLPTVQYPSTKAKNEAVAQGRYQQDKIILLDSEYYGRTKRLFTTAPVLQTNGRPASFYEVNVTTGLLKPFPDFPTYMNSTSISCKSLYSVFRTALDDCGRLWVLDSGKNESYEPGYQHCPPKLVLYDLDNNDREIFRYELPYGVYTDRSRFGNIVIESRNKDCSGSYAYLADSLDYALVVFDFANRKSWRISHKYFYPFPPYMTMSSNYTTLSGDVTDGVFGLALGPKTQSNRLLYYHSMASVRESWAPISVLKNQSIANSTPVTRKEYHLSPGRRSSPSTVEVMTKEGILIYPLIRSNQLVCWNSRTPFTRRNQHVIETDNKKFQFISGLKLYDNTLYIISCRYQVFDLGLVRNQTDANYRTMVVKDVNSWLRHTPCVSRTSTYPSMYNSNYNHYH